MRITGNPGETPERSRHCNGPVLFMRKQPLCVRGKAKGTQKPKSGDLPSDICHQETFADEVWCSERAIGSSDASRYSHLRTGSWFFCVPFCRGFLESLDKTSGGIS